LRPEAGSEEAHRVVIVRESAKLMRRRWQWESRAGFGPVEHSITLDNLGDGGRMVDFGLAAQGDYFSITDSDDSLSNRRIF
jgi:hypothetical protein